MGKFVETMEQVIIGGTDYSTNVRKCEIQFKSEDKDTTTFGSGGWHERLQGLKSADIVLEFLQDFAAGGIGATLMGYFLAGTPVSFEVRPVQAARSTSNPAFTGNVVPLTWTPLSGAIGDVAMVSVTWPATGAVAVQTS